MQDESTPAAVFKSGARTVDLSDESDPWDNAFPADNFGLHDLPMPSQEHADDAESDSDSDAAAVEETSPAVRKDEAEISDPQPDDGETMGQDSSSKDVGTSVDVEDLGAALLVKLDDLCAILIARQDRSEPAAADSSLARIEAAQAAMLAKIEALGSAIEALAEKSPTGDPERN